RPRFRLRAAQRLAPPGRCLGGDRTWRNRGRDLSAQGRGSPRPVPHRLLLPDHRAAAAAAVVLDRRGGARLRSPAGVDRAGGLAAGPAGGIGRPFRPSRAAGYGVVTRSREASTPQAPPPAKNRYRNTKQYRMAASPPFSI